MGTQQLVRNGRVTPRRRTLGLLGTVAAATLMLTACGGGTDGNGSNEPEGGGDGGPETTELLYAGFSSGIPSLPVIVAEEEGFFEEEGLTVEIELLENPGAIIPVLASGEAQFGYGSFASSFDAIVAGVDLVIITGSNQLLPNSNEIHVRDDSEINEVADLEGAVIGIPAVGSFNEAALAQVLATADLTVDDVTLQEVTNPNMLAAVEAGNVDAGYFSSPFNKSAAQDDTFRLLVDVTDVPALEGLVQGGTAAMREWADSNPNTIAAIRRAMDRAAEALEDEDYNREIQGRLGNMEPEVVAETEPFVYPGALTVDDIERFHQVLVDVGQAEPDFDPAGVIWNG